MYDFQIVQDLDSFLATRKEENLGRINELAQALLNNHIMVAIITTDRDGYMERQKTIMEEVLFSLSHSVEQVQAWSLKGCHGWDNGQSKVGMLSGKLDFGFRNKIWFYTFGLRNSNVFFYSFSSRKLHKNFPMSGKINSHICLMLSVYESFHQTVIYGQKGNYILQDLTGLEI